MPLYTVTRNGAPVRNSMPVSLSAACLAARRLNQENRTGRYGVTLAPVVVPGSEPYARYVDMLAAAAI